MILAYLVSIAYGWCYSNSASTLIIYKVIVEMKISTILSAFICAGLLSTNVAQASVIAESSIEIDNLALTFFDGNDANANTLTPGDDVLLNAVNISFTGTSVNTNLNGVADGDSFTADFRY